MQVRCSVFLKSSICLGALQQHVLACMLDFSIVQPVLSTAMQTVPSLDVVYTEEKGYTTVDVVSSVCLSLA